MMLEEMSKEIVNMINPEIPLKRQKQPEFVCHPDDPRVKKYGWKKSKFKGYLSFLPNENTIYISIIWSKKKQKGNFSNLIKEIRKDGYIIKIPNPFPRMEIICKHLGFVNNPEPFMGELIDCYVLTDEQDPLRLGRGSPARDALRGVGPGE